jgi:uncharacterized membrane protein
MGSYSQDRYNGNSQERTLTGLKVNTAALLCYVGVWVSGIVFLILEQKNRFVRFHSLQSIMTFGALFIAGSIVVRFPVIGGWLSGVISLIGFILWIVLMVKAGQGEWFKLPWVGDFAERLAQDTIPQPPPSGPSGSPGQSNPFPASSGSSNTSGSTNSAEASRPPQAAAGVPLQPEKTDQAAQPGQPLIPFAEASQPRVEPLSNVPPQASAASQPPVPPEPRAADQTPPANPRVDSQAEPIFVQSPPTRHTDRHDHLRHDRSWRSDDFKARYYSYGAHTGRIVGSSFAIAWSIILIIFLNYFHQYIAYYHPVAAGSNSVWEVYPLVTGAFESWLPIATLALIVSILGHAVMIAYDRYIARQITHMVVDAFGLASIISLVTIFPFDFSPIPNIDVVNGLELGLPAILIFISVCIGISLLVRFITLVVHLAENRV